MNSIKSQGSIITKTQAPSISTNCSLLLNNHLINMVMILRYIQEVLSMFLQQDTVYQRQIGNTTIDTARDAEEKATNRKTDRILVWLPFRVPSRIMGVKVTKDKAVIVLVEEFGVIRVQPGGGGLGFYQDLFNSQN